MHKKSIYCVEWMDASYWKNANWFADRFCEYLEDQNLSVEYAANSYLRMCSDQIKEQIYFSRTGEYRNSSFKEVNQSIYADTVFMREYMIGLALSQFLWLNHYKILSFYKQVNHEVLSKPLRRCLEVGAGHGLLSAILNNGLDVGHLDIIDISAASIEICKNVISRFSDNKNNITFHKEDANHYKSTHKYDYIIMGEIIEHVENPDIILHKFKNLLSEKGHMFITTCANCPAPDHIYLFRNLGEIRGLLLNEGFKIEREVALPVKNIGGKNKENQGLNYAAILSIK